RKKADRILADRGLIPRIGFLKFRLAPHGDGLATGPFGSFGQVPGARRDGGARCGSDLLELTMLLYSCSSSASWRVTNGHHPMRCSPPRKTCGVTGSATTRVSRRSLRLWTINRLGLPCFSLIFRPGAADPGYTLKTSMYGSGRADAV